MSAGGKLGLDSLPEVGIDDRFVLAGIDSSLVADFAAVDPVLQQGVERREKRWPPASTPPAPSRRLLTMPKRSSSSLSSRTEPSSP
jgi:hypothetical protein